LAALSLKQGEHDMQRLAQVSDVVSQFRARGGTRVVEPEYFGHGHLERVFGPAHMAAGTADQLIVVHLCLERGKGTGYEQAQPIPDQRRGAGLC
jgi:hypothetical protein